MESIKKIIDTQWQTNSWPLTQNCKWCQAHKASVTERKKESLGGKERGECAEGEADEAWQWRWE